MLDRGEADVELLDDGGVQRVEVQQQDELVVETDLSDCRQCKRSGGEHDERRGSAIALIYVLWQNTGNQ